MTVLDLELREDLSEEDTEVGGVCFFFTKLRNCIISKAKML